MNLNFKKSLLITAIVLLVIHLTIQAIFFINRELGVLHGIYALQAHIMLMTIPGAILGGLIALFPFKSLKFKEKFKITFPASTSVILIITIIPFGYLAFIKVVKENEIQPPLKFDEIKIPSNISCKEIHNGKFESEKSFIERNGDKQIEIVKKTGEQKLYKVDWTGECEYTLTPLKDTTQHVRVKITSLSSSNYKCYVILNNSRDKYPRYTTIKRIK